MGLKAKDRRYRRKTATTQSSLELLWGTSDKPGRGPKPGLSLGQIVGAGVALVSAEGLEALSMRRVAETLGFSAMSLYRYVPGKEELVDLMVDAAVGAPPELYATGTTWRAALEGWARANLTVYHRHPWLLQVVWSHPPQGPNRLAWLEAALQALAATKLSYAQMLAVVILLDRYVRSAAQTPAQAASSAAPADAPPTSAQAQWDAIFSRALEQRAEQFPMLHHVLKAGSLPEAARAPGTSEGVSNDVYDDSMYDDSVDFGLQRVLDGVESFVERSPN